MTQQEQIHLTILLNVLLERCKWKNQIAGFGYLSDKTEEAFILFFQKFKELVEEERNKNGGKGNFGNNFCM